MSFVLVVKLLLFAWDYQLEIDENKDFVKYFFFPKLRLDTKQK